MQREQGGREREEQEDDNEEEEEEDKGKDEEVEAEGSLIMFAVLPVRMNRASEGKEDIYLILNHHLCGTVAKSDSLESAF